MIGIWMAMLNLPRVYDTLLPPADALTSSAPRFILGPQTMFSAACGMVTCIQVT